MARPTIHTFLPCCPRSAEKMLKRLKIFYPTVGKTWPLQSSCYGSRKYCVNAWVLIPQYRTGCATEQNFFRRKNLICLRAKSIEITVTELDLLIRSSKVDRNRCRFVEFHDWIVLVRTSLFHEETNSRFLFAKLFCAQVEGQRLHKCESFQVGQRCFLQTSCPEK